MNDTDASATRRGHNPAMAAVPVVAIVTFPSRAKLDTTAMRALLEKSGPAYRSIPGLNRKYFLAGDGVAGGVYEWESRARAEAFYDDSWYEQMTASSGARPDVQLFDSPAIADGINHRLEIYLPKA